MAWLPFNDSGHSLPSDPCCSPTLHILSTPGRGRAAGITGLGEHLEGPRRPRPELTCLMEYPCDSARILPRQTRPSSHFQRADPQIYRWPAGVRCEAGGYAEWPRWPLASRTEPAVPGPMWYLTAARTGAMRRAPHQALISYHTPPPRPATSSATPRAGGAHYFLGRPGPPLRHGREPVALRFRDLSTARQARHNRVLPEHTSRLPHDAHLRRFFMGFPSTILVPPVRLSTTESHYLGFSALPFGDSRIV